MDTPSQTAATVEYVSVALVGANPHAALDSTLNSYAASGWQLVTIADRTLVFSRPLAAATTRNVRPALARYPCNLGDGAVAEVVSGEAEWRCDRNRRAVTSAPVKSTHIASSRGCRS